MKKLMGVMAMCGAVMVAGCDSGAKNGNTVVIDFAGFMGSEQFAGGTASNYPLKLGSGTFIPGFEDQLVGAKVGETREVKITFPEDYQATSLAGKEAVFKVTIKEIKK
ncbi:MAG: FKBP-type peptidyl-prolyl cis-trans isomerase [Alphaproteobacteria bacterium]|nr:FKBP-type peptidyl-prolyl cis-trans isomerase [Alphaproteobacteria bacterium]